MTTARDVIANRFRLYHRGEPAENDAEAFADGCIGALETAPEPVRKELAALLNPIDFMQAMKICKFGFDTWACKPHNQKWFKRIEGTPIPNDLLVNIAEAMMHASGPSPSSARAIGETE